MNWGELQSLASAYVHRSDLPWDSLQVLLCADISIALIVPENEAFDTLTLLGPDQYGLYSGVLPDGYARMRSVRQGNYTLDPTDIKTLIERKGSRYAISGLNLYTPGASDVGIVYSSMVEPIASDDATSDILSRYPNLYLYGLLKHAAIVMQDPEINAQFFEAQFESALSAANGMYWDAALGPGAMAVPMGGIV